MARVLDKSSLTFVYPFSFKASEFKDLVGQVTNAKVETEKSTQAFWVNGNFPHDELLPHISSYLKHDSGKELTARLWNIDKNVGLNSYGALGAIADWRFIYKREDENDVTQWFEVPFKFKNIQLFLFRAGVGMLTIQVALQTDALESWQDFLHFFRFFNRPNAKLSARRRKNKEEIVDFFPTFTADGEERNEGNIGEIVDNLLHTAGKNEWWKGVFLKNKMMAYSALFITNHSPQDDYRLLYKLRNFFHTKQGEHPAPSDLLANHPSLLEYSERQWFVFALEGGNFLACDPPDTTFFRQTLPAHIRDQYFHLYIIALHQRFGLMDMSHDVAEHWWAENEGERLKAFERIRNRFLDFTARGYFAQVMQSEHHHRNYRKWQETFELQRLYDEVREEVREMFDWLQLKISQETAERTTKFERRVSIFALLIALGIGIPALVAGFFGMNISDMPESFNLTFRYALYLFLGTIIISVLIAVSIYFYMNKERKPPRNDDEK